MRYPSSLYFFHAGLEQLQPFASYLEPTSTLNQKELTFEKSIMYLRLFFRLYLQCVGFPSALQSPKVVLMMSSLSGNRTLDGEVYFISCWLTHSPKFGTFHPLFICKQDKHKRWTLFARDARYCPRRAGVRSFSVGTDSIVIWHISLHASYNANRRLQSQAMS